MASGNRFHIFFPVFICLTKTLHSDQFSSHIELRTFYFVYESHFDPIPEETKQYLLKLSRDITPVFDTGDIGLVYLDKDEMMKIFGAYMKKHFKKENKFSAQRTHKGKKAKRNRFMVWSKTGHHYPD